MIVGHGAFDNRAHRQVMDNEEVLVVARITEGNDKMLGGREAILEMDRPLVRQRLGCEPGQYAAQVSAVHASDLIDAHGRTVSSGVEQGQFGPAVGTATPAHAISLPPRVSAVATVL